jgi:hypothetical protein
MEVNGQSAGEQPIGDQRPLITFPLILSERTH